MSQCPIIPPFGGDPAITTLGQQLVSLQQFFNSPSNLINIINSGGGSVTPVTVIAGTGITVTGGPNYTVALTTSYSAGTRITFSGSGTVSVNADDQLPTRPANDGNTYALTILNGVLSWTIVQDCP